MLKFYLGRTTVLIAAIILISTTARSQDPPLVLAPVISGLTFPIQIVNAGDGTNRLFVVLQGGSVIVYNNLYTKIDTFLKVSGISSTGEQGLLSMVFHPEYENSGSPFFGLFFVYYTNSAGDLEIARYHVSGGNPNKADTTTRVTVTTIPHPTNQNHNGGTLHFGNDGYLYLATGDGGGGGDFPNNAQNPLQLLGKMIRIDVNSSATAPFYSIPPSNPYVGVTVPDTLDEIYSFGLRNPFRWSFDRTTHDIWIGDVGQGTWEEIDYKAAGTTAGTNYGWRCYEGNDPYNTVGCGPIGNYTFPVYQFANVHPSAVTGGTVYRGSRPGNGTLVGYYLATDFYTGHIYKIRSNGSGGWITTIQSSVKTGIANFGETESGELLAVSLFAGDVSTINVDAVLPVQLISFTAELNRDAVQLKWKTAFEQNMDQFVVEYSLDGVNFMQAGIVKAENNANGAEYSFNHRVSLKGRVYYRLKIVDLDAKYDYSPVRNVMVETTNYNFVHPSFINTGVMTVFIDEPWQYLQVISSNGAVMLNRNLNGQSGRIDIQLPLTLHGLYIVRLRRDEKMVSQKVMIQ